MCSAAGAFLYNYYNIMIIHFRRRRACLPKWRRKRWRWVGDETTGTHNYGQDFSEDSKGRLKRCVSFSFCVTLSPFVVLTLIKHWALVTSSIDPPMHQVSVNKDL